MKRRTMKVALVAAGATLVACQSDEPRVGQEGNVQFAIGALTVPGPASTASYRVTIEVLSGRGEAARFTKFQTFEVDSEKGSAGATEFIGTCLASDDGTPVAHRATIELVAAADADGNSLLDGCEGERKQQRPFDCINGGDTRVAAEFHLMCEVARGFSDFTFELDNVYCQTKIDCPPEPLLYDPAIDARVPTMVVGATCTKDPAGETQFEIPVFVSIICSDESGIGPDQDDNGDVDVTKNERFRVENYQGEELIEGIKFNNFAYSLAPEAFEGAKGCRVDVSVWAEELDADGNFVKEEVRRDAAIVHMTTNLAVSEEGVSCNNTKVQTRILPVLALRGDKGDAGPSLHAVSYAFAGDGFQVVRPACFDTHKKGTEAAPGWSVKRKAALDAKVDSAKNETLLEAAEAELDKLNVEGKAEMKAFDAAITELTGAKTSVEEGQAEVSDVVEQFFGAAQQNNMQQQERKICEVYGKARDEYNAGTIGAAGVLDAIRSHRQNDLRKAIEGIADLDPTIATIDAAYAKLGAYATIGADARGSFDAANEALDKLRAGVQKVEADLVANALDAAGIAAALDGLTNSCSAADGKARGLVARIGTLRDELNAGIAEQTQLRDTYQTAHDGLVAAKDQEIANLKGLIKTSDTAFADNSDAAIALYDAMLAECETRKNPLLIAVGDYRVASAEAGLPNIRAYMYGSETETTEASIIDFCDAEGEYLIAFTVKNGYHSFLAYEDGKQMSVVGVAGEFADDWIGAGNTAPCGSQYLGYPGTLDQATETR